ncbi:3-oxoacyl-ACP reductase [Moesziomyces antarcticus]|uniref:Related to 3-oxoacyl-[acyl-carrier protein] reductase n=1 Tax=Pseudozyma antarctica TaxID=84753 RepID=A0A5C3FEW4_PSEA2|nr:3-oxoacyl-ACP reductase [Moesziomyces antarcticus]GAK62416.1 3-oxoacyl-ACP reductase [Moesziomyces antarcticus]SPO42964.1 related to 3-oxoacyl-[acyl-carrier protein] reductase [Moesziomyces antarcticus]
MSSNDHIESYPRPGKTAIVTGGSSGLGRTSAVALARAGWNVTVTGRRETELRESCDQIDAASGRSSSHYVAGDITKEDVVLRVFKETAEKFGRIDLVFCNAGISPPNVPLAEQKLSDWQATVDVNLTAAWLCAREAYRYMEKQSPQGGRIIINGSISAYAPRPNTSPYTATKTAMTGLTKSLSLDGRKFNIAVTQIDVGNAASEMTAKMKEGPGVPQADGSMRHEPTMDREWVGKEIVHIAEMPLSVNIGNVVIQATNMPSHVGRG